MNSEEIIKVIDELCKKFGVAIDWTSQNVLPYLQELGHRIAIYKIAMSAIGVFIGLVFLVLGICLCKKVISEYLYCRKNKKDTVWWDYDFGPEAPAFFSMVGIGAAGIIALAVLSCSIPELIKWVVVPELGLFEYLQGLM